MKLRNYLILVLLISLFSVSSGASLHQHNLLQDDEVVNNNTTSNNNSSSSEAEFFSTFTFSDFAKNALHNVKINWNSTNDTKISEEPITINKNNNRFSKNFKYHPVVTRHQQHNNIKTVVKPNKTADTTDSNISTNPSVMPTCDYEFGCQISKAFKVLGISFAGGLIVALLSPAMLYFLSSLIGVIFYVCILVSFTLVCRSRDGNAIGQSYLTSCRSVGEYGVRMMFTMLPILLLWLTYACLIGFIIWPYIQ